MNGYTKDSVEEKTIKEGGREIIGKQYSVTFYLPGDTVDRDQRFFVKEGEDVDDVLSKAYYEKHMSLVKEHDVTPVDGSETGVVQSPRPFLQFRSDKEFKGKGEALLDMLKNGELPVDSFMGELMPVEKMAQGTK